MSEMTPEEIRAEIAEARKIIREDKIIAGQKAIHEKLAKHFPDNPQNTDPGVPPSPDPKPDPEPAAKPKGKWWGDALDN